MSCISSLLMNDHCEFSSPQWCSGVYPASPTGDRGSISVENTISLIWNVMLSCLLHCHCPAKTLTGVPLSFFIGRHEKKHKGQHCCFYRSSWKKHKGNNRKTHIHFNVMYILFIDDWLLCIVIASVVQWSALCLTHWRPRLNFCGQHNIFNLKRNAIMSIVIYNHRQI